MKKIFTLFAILLMASGMAFANGRINLHLTGCTSNEGNPTTYTEEDEGGVELYFTAEDGYTLKDWEVTVKHGETILPVNNYASLFGYVYLDPNAAGYVYFIWFDEFTDDFDVTINCKIATPEVTLIANEETEYALSSQSSVTIDKPISAIKVAGLNQGKDYTYKFSEGTTSLAEGLLSVNTIGYAEFDPLSLYEGHTYALTLATGSETVATYTLIGAMEEEKIEVTLMGNDFETEFTLSEQSTVTVDKPVSAIKATNVMDYREADVNYAINDGTKNVAEGLLSINTIGYAEFQDVSLYEGTTYTVTLTAAGETIYTATVAGGCEKEADELDFTDKVVKEVKANTSNIEEGKWYAWSNPRKANSQYAAPTPFYDQGEGKKPVREAAGQTVRTVLSQNTPVSDVTKYLVRFVKSGTGEAYHIQFATGNYLKKDLTTSATAEEAGLFMVYAATNSKSDAAGEPYTEAGVGINITDDGVAYGSRLDGNGAGAELVTWGNSKIETPDANNVWFFEEVEMAEPTTETYTVHITGAPNETKVTFGEQQYGDGETFDATGFSLSQLTVPDHEDYVKSVEIDGTDIYVTYTYAKKVADLSEINNEHAYVLICERGQLTTNEGELAPTAEKSYTESKSVFAFVKYNDNYYLWSTAEEGFVFNDKTIATEGEFQNVVFNPQEDGTFVLYIADNEHYINIDGTTTLFIDAWDTADAGNKYSIYEVETFDATDALNILEDFTTGINAVATPAAPAAIYSLTGQRQQRLQKGINIVRRQKVIK